MSFFEIFQPGLRHLREERDRLKTLVSKPTHGGGAPLGIDLLGGKATFTMPARKIDDTAAGEPTRDASEDADPPAPRSPDVEPGPPVEQDRPH
jgi:hypothetical protein